MGRESESRGCCSLALFYLLGRFADNLVQMINEARKNEPRTLYAGGMSSEKWDAYKASRSTKQESAKQ